MKICTGKKILASIVFTLLATTVNAISGDDYRCVVERITLAQGDVGAKYESYKKAYIGKEFTIERTSGMMAGALKNSFTTKPQVIDFGSKENAFKAITTMRSDQSAGGGSNIYAITILEYLDEVQKPFVIGFI